ncbi:MAG TPA: sulfatase-like hydrolase/transferase [Planctomycetota bacterium]|nr:sulfatase-like hydrolase/transferase [Planctomycetota bacterium]
MAKDRPNIILITTDQQRYDTCGPAAPTFMRMPHFDNLSREGITFSKAYADCAVCVPARVGIMTGKTALLHGKLDNGETSAVLGRENTLPGCMRTLGYQTAAIGKMHFGPERVRHGFDDMIIPSDYYRQMERSGVPVKPMHHGLGQNGLHPRAAGPDGSVLPVVLVAQPCRSRETQGPARPPSRRADRAASVAQLEAPEGWRADGAAREDDVHRGHP